MQDESKEIVPGDEAQMPAALPDTLWNKVCAAGPLVEYPDLNENADPASTYNNVMAFFERYGLTLAYDAFANKLRIGGFPGKTVYNDAVRAGLITVMHRTGLDLKENKFDTFIASMAHDNTKHPLRELLDKLEFGYWDGVRRLDTWLIDYCFAEDTPYNRWISRTSLLLAVRRVRAPGFPCKLLFILEGEQTIGKSPVIKILALNKFYSDAVNLMSESKEVMELAAGIWYFEFAEMHGRGKKDIDRIKAMLSRDEYRARLAYDRVGSEMGRHWVYWGTINPDGLGYLQDPTGNDRFMPVKCNARLPDGRTKEDLLDLVGLNRDMLQIYAEACIEERVTPDDAFQLPDDIRKEARVEQEGRREISEIEGELKAALDGVKSGFIPNATIYHILALDPATVTHNAFVTRQVKGAMIKLGWVQDTRRLRLKNRNGGGTKDKQFRGYSKGALPATGMLTECLTFDGDSGTVDKTGEAFW